MAMMMDDTIAAIATAPGEGAVAIVRLSGPETFRIADTIFRGRGNPPSQRESHTVAYGEILTEHGEPIDEVLVLTMRAPNSYTREDVVEVQSHGGHLSARRILRRILDEGARSAEPGEFTRRAFLNGRIDLMQAEAVIDLVRSKSERAAIAAEEQLTGVLSQKFNDLYDRIVAVAADLEATLDFSDDELPEAIFSEIRDRLVRIRFDISGLIDTWDEGRLLRDGALVVISGKPNVGKSTLMNTLLGVDRSIISSTPGTTRDTIEEGLVLNGIPLRLVDTAGLRTSDCEIEQEGILRAEKIMQDASVQMFMIDSSRPFDEEDHQILSRLQPDSSVVVLNKIDLGLRIDLSLLKSWTVVQTSLIRGEGIDLIRRALGECLERGLNLALSPHAVVSERHRELLSDSLKQLDLAIELISLDEDQSLLAASKLRMVLERIGESTGREYHDELLDRIFAQFCIGK